jgi:hypothetical protein
MIETTDDDVWRYHGTTGDFASALACLGLEPSTTSPLHGVLDGGANPANERGDADPLNTDPAFRLLLMTLAAPRRLFTYCAHSAEATELVSFLVGDAAVIGLKLAETIHASAPMSAIELVELITRFIDPAAADERPVDLAAISLLPVLAKLFELGLRNGEPVEISASETTAAVELGIADTGDPAAGLAALEQDKVLTRVQDHFRLTSEWLERHAYLADEDRIELTSVELPDIQDGFAASRQVSIIGRRGQQRIALAASPHSSDALHLIPLTAPLLARAVLALVAPPSLPSVTRRGDTPHLDPVRWLQSDAGGGQVRNWQIATPAELVGALGGGDTADAAEAVLAPSAQVSITIRDPQDTADRQLIIGVTDAGAIEWTPAGSRVRWRPLRSGGVDAVLRDELAPGPRVQAGPGGQVHLSSEQFSALCATSSSAEDATAMPAALQSLKNSPGLTWCGIDVSTVTQDQRLNPPLWLGRSGDGTIWQFQASDDGVSARVVELGAATSKLIDTLSEPGKHDHRVSERASGA